MTKIPDDISLTLNQVKFPEDTPGNTDGVKYPTIFPLTQNGLNSQRFTYKTKS